MATGSGEPTDEEPPAPGTPPATVEQSPAVAATVPADALADTGAGTPAIALGAALGALFSGAALLLTRRRHARP